ncbi:MAG: cell division protein ZapA [bacterium]
MENKKKFKIIILGKEYTITTDEDESCIKNAAELLNNLLQEYNEKAPSIGEAQRNLLVALQLATDLTKNSGILKSNDSRLKELNSLLNDSL